jgi:hypothetical protein
VLLVSISGDGSAVTRRSQSKIKPPTATMTYPRMGDVFVPGEQVTVTWEVNPGNVSFCEQELHLILNGGKQWVRISRELGEESRSFEWTVPDMPTEHAVLAINLGCDRRPYASFEGVNVQSQAVFQILPARDGYQGVEVASGKTSAHPGEQVPVTWTSSVVDVDQFEVLISYDRGASFNSIGETRDTNFVWTVPKDFSGSVVFSIVARRFNGTRVESSLRPDPPMVVRRQ